MRVAYLTAGAAGTYCGSCLRDNTLAAALRAKGRDVLLIPLYTPIRTDEPDVSERRVYYGAINVYLQEHSALFRHLPAWLTRVLDSPALLRRLARFSGRESFEELGKLTVSTLRGQDGHQRQELSKLINGLSDLRPDLVNLANAMFVQLARPIRETLGVPVLCTLTGEDAFLDKLPEPYQAEVVDLIRRQQQHVDGFVAVSDYYAAYCRERFDIDADRMHVVRLGVRVDDPKPRPEPPAEPFIVGYLARICPDKGLHALCEAIGMLRRAGRHIRLVVAGYMAPGFDDYFQNARKSLIDRNHPEGFDYLGEVDRAGKLAMLRSLHLLSVPTVYRDPKGLFVLESLANGVPVVQPGHGAFPELVEATGGGLLVEPNNAKALADGIARLMDDPDLHRRLGSQGRKAVLESFTDEVMAERTWSLYRTYSKADHD